MIDAFKHCLDKFQLEQLDTYLFRYSGKNAGIQRIYGGQVIAQAYLAANLTIEDDKHLHSLHAYFLRPGIKKQPVIYSVDPIRNGMSFSTRTVKAIQNNETIFSMSLSFQKDEEGLSHSIEMPKVPPPEDLKDEIELRQDNIDLVPEELREYFTRERECTVKPVEWQDVFNPQKMSPRRSMWMKPNGKLPKNREIQNAFLAYISDAGILAAALFPHGITYMSPKIMIASLDHTMWFHKPDFEFNDWILYTMDSPYSGNSRGLGRGTFFTREGEVIASVTQEGLLRTKTR